MNECKLWWQRRTEGEKMLKGRREAGKKEKKERKNILKVVKTEGKKTVSEGEKVSQCDSGGKRK